ncbi:MAG: hypothetical protein PHO55_03990 [Thiomonas arsenitoxydans]|nr:hypothetical protein [Thiomonas arsenitoxydans]
MTNADGRVPSSRSGLMRAANISQVEFDIALNVLESPDPDSRSPEHDGRRVEKIEGGWLILNYKKYRQYTPRGGDPDSPGAIRTRKWREKRDAELRCVTETNTVTPKSSGGDVGDITETPMVTSQSVTGVTSASASVLLDSIPLELISLDTKGEYEGGGVDERFQEFWDTTISASRPRLAPP